VCWYVELVEVEWLKTNVHVRCERVWKWFLPVPVFVSLMTGGCRLLGMGVHAWVFGRINLALIYKLCLWANIEYQKVYTNTHFQRSALLSDAGHDERFSG
jgi:hypothetical protein